MKHTHIFHYLLVICLLSVFLLSCNKWRQVWGDNSLGGNFSLLEGDVKEDRIIVYCAGWNVGVCSAVITILPVYERQFEKGEYAEYVEDAVYDKKWILAKTWRIKENHRNYWIISKILNLENIDCKTMNCDSILQSHVIGPLNFDEFQNKIKSLNINLELK